MRTRDTDLIVRLVDFNLPMIGSTQKMKVEPFMDNVINNKYFNDRLEVGLIKSCFTHQARDRADADTSDTPYDDLIASDKDLAGVLRDVWVERDDSRSIHSAFAAIDLLPDLEGGQKVKTHIKNSMYMGISMATDSSIDVMSNDFIINELKGADFTVDGAFMKSGIVAVKQNFSKSKTPNGYNVNFSNASTANGMIMKSDINNFSLKDYLRELLKPRYMVIAGRIREAIRLLSTYDTEKIKEHRSDIMVYVNSMIYDWISAALEGPGRINIEIGLRISQFLSPTSAAAEFNIRMNLVKNMYRSQGYISKDNQNKMNTAISDLFVALWTYIAKKAKVDIGLFFDSADHDTIVRM